MSLGDYRVCTDTVTVYRDTDQGIRRVVLENCFLSHRYSLWQTVTGGKSRSAFLLIVPGDKPEVCLGDRVYYGEGPQVTDRIFQDVFTALPVVKKIKPYFWQGQLCHREAEGE